jgi:hypothetical protein
MKWFIVQSKSSVLKSSMDSLACCLPALLTTMSSPPNCLTACSTSSTQNASSRRSPGWRWLCVRPDGLNLATTKNFVPHPALLKSSRGHVHNAHPLIPRTIYFAPLRQPDHSGVFVRSHNSRGYLQLPAMPSKSSRDPIDPNKPNNPNNPINPDNPNNPANPNSPLNPPDNPNFPFKLHTTIPFRLESHLAPNLFIMRFDCDLPCNVRGSVVTIEGDGKTS